MSKEMTKGKNFIKHSKAKSHKSYELKIMNDNFKI